MASINGVLESGAYDFKKAEKSAYSLLMSSLNSRIPFVVHLTFLPSSLFSAVIRLIVNFTLPSTDFGMRPCFCPCFINSSLTLSDPQISTSADLEQPDKI